MTIEERNKLKALSTEAFGVSSKWQKLLEKPVIKDQERTLDDGTVQKYKGTAYRTLDEVVEILTKAVEMKQEQLAKQKEAEDKKVLEAAEKVMEDHKETFEKLAQAEQEEKNVGSGQTTTNS